MPRAQDLSTEELLSIAGESSSSRDLSGMSTAELQRIAGTPSSTGLDSMLGRRRSAVREFQEEFRSPSAILNVLGLNPTRPMSRLELGMKGLGAAQEQFESVIASPILDLIRKRPRDIPGNVLKGITGERPVERGDIAREFGAPEPVAALFGLATGPETLLPSMAGIRAGGRGVQVAGQSIRQFFRGKPGLTADQLVQLSEQELAKQPSLERVAAFEQRASQLKTQTQQSTAHLARLAEKTQQLLATRTKTTQKGLPRVAAQDLKRLETIYPTVRDRNSVEYRRLIDNALDAKPSLRFTKEQITEGITEELLDTDPVLYRAVMEEVDKAPALQRNFDLGVNVAPRDLLETADDLASKVSRAVREKSRAPTSEEFVADHLKGILHRMLERNGIDVTPAKRHWAGWVPVRNMALQLQRPQGPGKLLSIMRGKNPIGEQRFNQLQALAGVRLDRTTRAAFNQLDYLGQRHALEQIKRLERQRVLQETTHLASQSWKAKQLRVEQQARHVEKIRNIIGSTIKLATGGAAFEIGRRALGGGVSQLFGMGDSQSP